MGLFSRSATATRTATRPRRSPRHPPRRSSTPAPPPSTTSPATTPSTSPTPGSASPPGTRWSPPSAASSPSSRAPPTSTPPTRRPPAPRSPSAPPASAPARPTATATCVSADFFDVETFPEITFVTTDVTRADAATWTVTGDLTIKGVTSPVIDRLRVHRLGQGPLRQPAGRLRGQHHHQPQGLGPDLERRARDRWRAGQREDQARVRRLRHRRARRLLTLCLPEE